MKLSSISDIDAFLVSVDKKKCPWCDGNNWAIRITPETDLQSTDSIKGIRGLPELKMFTEDDKLKGELSLGVANILPLIIVRCNTCGHIYLFDYFKINEILHEKKQLDSAQVDEVAHE
ncbi:TPA: hypothetical protein L3H17_003722 [Morganella morganii]|nr:hypothetical protein [Morganella morganii]